METRKYKIKKVNTINFAINLSIFNASLALFLILLFLFIVIIFSVIISMILPSHSTQLAGTAFGLSLVMLIYSIFILGGVVVISFILGLIIASIYNKIVTKITGGLEIEISQE